ncbi:hypothetical protein [Neobacillus sp. PS3-40]|nr:hypothetical protein [Neobacillus sp. PS3-40]WML44871.1 hypothetical protein RCG20_02900 [Neobacillus sp. PS3-40]
MKSQRIPEHKLNVTTTVGKALENMTSMESPKPIASEKKEVNQSDFSEGK